MINKNQIVMKKRMVVVPVEGTFFSMAMVCLRSKTTNVLYHSGELITTVSYNTYKKMRLPREVRVWISEDGRRRVECIIEPS